MKFLIFFIWFLSDEEEDIEDLLDEDKLVIILTCIIHKQTTKFNYGIFPYSVEQ